MSTVISIENVSKTYRLGDIGGGTLRDDFARWWAKLRGDPDPLAEITDQPHARQMGDLFLALDNVSFEVKQGEVLGIIGRNGAGKSTLLKILSQVTLPSSGQLKIKGRIASLLEVGTGFHPDLTGRENIFLNGAILGMTKAEIRRKFDAIVAFSELEQFIDTPVKRYSSGMYVRLAFAVAAHLEPEILIIDEVLAVGDINFQKKCLGKMGDVSKEGRTVVLVSHQLNQMRRLCHRAIWIEGGQKRIDGDVHEVLAGYESAMFSGERANGLKSNVGAKGHFLRWELEGKGGERPHVLSTLGPVTINFITKILQPITRGDHGLALFDANRRLMWACAAHNLALQPGVYILSHTLPMLPLRPGPYQWQVTLWEDKVLIDTFDCMPEMIVATETHQHHMDEWNGILNLPDKFSHAMTEEIPVERN